MYGLLLQLLLLLLFKPVKLRLKIDLVSYPVRAEGLVNMIIIIFIIISYLQP